jgi:hypothetical protein
MQMNMATETSLHLNVEKKQTLFDFERNLSSKFYYFLDSFLRSPFRV